MLRKQIFFKSGAEPQTPKSLTIQGLGQSVRQIYERTCLGQITPDEVRAVEYDDQSSLSFDSVNPCNAFGVELEQVKTLRATAINQFNSEVAKLPTPQKNGDGGTQGPTPTAAGGSPV